MKAKSSKIKIHNRRGAKPNPPSFIMASFGQLTYLYSLLETAEIPEHERVEYMDSEYLTEGEAEKAISYLKDNQRNNILGGFNYSQGDILEMLKKL